MTKAEVIAALERDLADAQERMRIWASKGDVLSSGVANHYQGQAMALQDALRYVNSMRDGDSK